MGLLSGTSMDGISTALVDITSQGNDIHVDPIRWETYPYPPQFKKSLLNLARSGTVEDLCEINYRLGELFAEAAIALMEEGDEEVDLIGSHGQTICHLPAQKPNNATTTLQIGEADVIAQETGITTVSDFRQRDVAAGGEGAPLLPYVVYHLFKSDKENRGILNLGGIADITYIPTKPNLHNVIAFDTGPGNMIIDQLAREFSNQEKQFDKNGRMAAQGEVNDDLLIWLMKHPFIKKDPPKSTGRIDFGQNFVSKLLEKAAKYKLTKQDIMATTTAFTANAIYWNCKHYLGELDRIIASGGGIHNQTLMKMLTKRFHIPIETTEVYGIPIEAKEPIGFAVLAYQTYYRRPNNLPKVTGASENVILGKISPGEKNRE